MIPVSKPKIFKQDIKNVSKSLRDGWISSDGPQVLKFENKFAKYIGKKYCISVSSGTAALDIAVKCLNLKKNDEVIIPNFTIISNALAVLRQGAKPIFVDCGLNDWNIDLQDLKKKISKKTKAIIVTHIYSYSNYMEKIVKICKAHKIKIIEDAAEVLGLKYKNKFCGAYGDMGTFSFYANKHITTGEGGMICTNNFNYYKKCKSLRNLCFGKVNRFNHDDLGWNYRMTNMQASIGISQLDNINKVIKKKIYIGKYYYNNFKDNKFIQILPPYKDGLINIYWVVGIVIKNRKILAKKIIDILKKNNIGSRPFFWPMHKQEILIKMKQVKYKNYPNSEFISKYGLYLPSYVDLKKRDLDKIINIVNNNIK